MKLNLISAYLVVCLSFSLQAMEELKNDSCLTKACYTNEGNGSRFIDMSKPDIDIMNSFIEQETFYSSDEEDLSTPDGYLSPEELDPEEVLQGSSLHWEDKRESKKWEDLTPYDLALYSKDKTYQLIPKKDQLSFIKKEWKFKQDENSFYCKMKIYEIADAKKRYEAIKYYEKNDSFWKPFVYGELAVIGAAVTGAGIACAGVGIVSYLNNRQ